MRASAIEGATLAQISAVLSVFAFGFWLSGTRPSWAPAGQASKAKAPRNINGPRDRGVRPCVRENVGMDRPREWPHPRPRGLCWADLSSVRLPHGGSLNHQIGLQGAGGLDRRKDGDDPRGLTPIRLSPLTSALRLYPPTMAT
jgi:hypothetical protein